MTAARNTGVPLGESASRSHLQNFISHSLFSPSRPPGYIFISGSIRDAEKARTAQRQLQTQPMLCQAKRSSLSLALQLGWPVDGRVLQSSLDHFLAELIGPFANARAGRKMVFMHSIFVSLLADALIITRDALIRNSLETHTELHKFAKSNSMWMDASRG